MPDIAARKIWLRPNTAIRDSLNVLAMAIGKIEKALAAYPEREIREKAGP